MRTRSRSVGPVPPPPLSVATLVSLLFLCLCSHTGERDTLSKESSRKHGELYSGATLERAGLFLWPNKQNSLLANCDFTLETVSKTCTHSPLPLGCWNGKSQNDRASTLGDASHTCVYATSLPSSCHLRVDLAPSVILHSQRTGARLSVLKARGPIPRAYARLQSAYA